MKRYSVVIEAPHAELGTQRREYITSSVNELTNAIVGVAEDHPDTPFTFTITATEIHE